MMMLQSLVGTVLRYMTQVCSTHYNIFHYNHTIKLEKETLNYSTLIQLLHIKLDLLLLTISNSSCSILSTGGTDVHSIAILL